MENGLPCQRNAGPKPRWYAVRTAPRPEKRGCWEDFARRGQAPYLLPGSDHLNRTQGPEFSVWFPSPATDHRFFLRDTVGIFVIHETITNLSDNPLTDSQTSSKSA